MDSLGLQPLVTSLNNQGGWPMVTDGWDPPAHFDLAAALVDLRFHQRLSDFWAWVDANVFNVSRRVVYVQAGTVPLGLGLMSQATDAVLDAYRAFMTAAAKELRQELGSSATDERDRGAGAGGGGLRDRVQQDSSWETNVAGIQADLDDGVPGQFNFLAFMKEMFTNTGVTINEDEPVISFKSPFFANLTTMLANTPPHTIANAIGWWWAYDIGRETTYAMRNISFDFQQALTGATEPSPRWEHCLPQANYNLGFALSRAYTSELVEDLRAAFNSLLDENTWMLEDDLAVAREKLAAIDPFVAYPDWIMDDAELTNGYEDLEILSGKEYDNLLAIGNWFDRNSLASLREVPVHSFLFPPTVVNAFYNPQENTIRRLFDKQGNLVQWWSDETIAAYEERAKCFVDQYNGFIPPELIEAGLNISVNGVQTEGENIADNGGIREAYKAYQLYVERYGEEPRLPGLDEFTPDHLFYLGFANVRWFIWCIGVIY
ncbi:putative neprilysin-11-like [Penaeus vannamei]|uniref:Putative neprilysin-11-like n=1 Tax=Penaeus vannamei TaxID=6689 RepID=A0A3R7SPS7_PENVA|nr:putative neprilysin-11-like [Penaeus vannamei]